MSLKDNQLTRDKSLSEKRIGKRRLCSVAGRNVLCTRCCQDFVKRERERERDRKRAILFLIICAAEGDNVDDCVIEAARVAREIIYQWPKARFIERETRRR